MDQTHGLAVLERGESALITGPAGSGKTFLLSRFITHAKQAGKKVAVTATTGLAATHLGGATIHTWSGIGVAQSLPPQFIATMSKTRREQIERADVLIIDEISMLHDYRLDMVDTICRQVRDCDAPFGGLQVVMSGDFFQLPPVNRAGETGGFAVQARAWAELNPRVVYLQEQHRQDDDELLGILNALRAGDIRRHHAEALLARVDISPPPGQGVTELHTTNADVDSINARHLAALPGQPRSYDYATTGSKNYVESLQRSVLAPAELVLKKGALVMAVKNSPTRQYANGSIGVVEDFETGTEYPVVRFTNGRVVTMVPASWELRDGTRKRASISQIPLRLAWAITVHKSQGMTLDAARIDLRKAFTPGMGYVALSRVKNLRNLYLYGINRIALQMDPQAHRINQWLLEQAQQANPQG